MYKPYEKLRVTKQASSQCYDFKTNFKLYVSELLEMLN